MKARPFDATSGPVKWAYSTGGTAVAPPTVSGGGVLALSNDRTVHALTRGSAGGEWPASWMPAELMGVGHSRSPVVPFVVPLAGSNTVLFAGDDAGFVHAIDAVTGLRPWPAQGPSLAMTGAPGGIFTQYSGNRDLLFVGTRDGNVRQLAARAEARGRHSARGLRRRGQPRPDRPDQRHARDRLRHPAHLLRLRRPGWAATRCSASRSPTPHAARPRLQMVARTSATSPGAPCCAAAACTSGRRMALVYSLDAATGGDDHTFSPADGPVKGFLFPDRRNDDLIFATDTKVWSISDDGARMTKNWQWTTRG